MAEQTNDMRKKGAFSRLRLATAKDYIFPVSRRNMILIGGVGALAFLAVFAFDILFGKSHLISNGPLSSNHANFEQDCANCHTPAASVTNDKCSVCHEKYGDDLGVYTFKAHYVYRSNDLSRVSSSAKYATEERPCFACHPEHTGREAMITRVPDAQCLPCHPFGSFNGKHPQFEFFGKSSPDHAGLKFAHVAHVERVQKRENLVDIEKTCLYCHNPQPDGKNFQPMSFDRHCDACHLTTDDATPWLPIKAQADAPGVETLDTILQRQGPGTLWASYTNRNEFDLLGGSIKKKPIYHQDPWIMENLKMLRRQIYPEPGLTDLLKASGETSLPESKSLYREAIQTLRDYAAGLRSRPEREVQRELTQIDRYLKEVEEKLNNPHSPLDDTKFLLSTVRENPQLTPEQIAAFKNAAINLTKPCGKCHTVTNATILRVQKDQRVLQRAEFNHREHILQRRCLQCHTQIPFEEFIGNSAQLEPGRDQAAIQMIPAIQTCRECHQAGATSNRCVTCHYFHSNKTNRSNLLLYLD